MNNQSEFIDPAELPATVCSISIIDGDDLPGVAYNTVITLTPEGDAEIGKMIRDVFSMELLLGNTDTLPDGRIQYSMNLPEQQRNDLRHGMGVAASMLPGSISVN